MRIGLFAYTDDVPTLDTGVTTYNRELVKRLCERYPAHSFHVYLAPKNSESFSDIEYSNLKKIVVARAADAGGKRVRRVGALGDLAGFIFTEALHRLGVSLGRTTGLYESIDQLGAHDLVIYTVFGLFPDFPLYVTRKLGVPCISVIHDVRVLYSKPDTLKRRVSVWRQRYVLSRIVREGEHVLVPSNYIRELLLSKFAADPASISVSYVVPKVTKADSSAAFSAVVQDIAASAKRYLFYPSTLVETKNHLRLAHAIKLLTQSEPDVLLVLAGSNRDSELGKELFRYVASESLTTHIVHAGFVSDAEKTFLYENAVALVVPSIGESFSLPIWEAFAHGCPVIASIDRDIPEQVQGAALPCDPLSPEDIARKIAMLWRDDDSLRQQLIQRGRERYEEAKRTSFFTGWEAAFEGAGALIDSGSGNNGAARRRHRRDNRGGEQTVR